MHHPKKVRQKLKKLKKRMLEFSEKIKKQCVGKKNIFIFKKWETKLIKRRKLKKRSNWKVLKRMLWDQIILELLQN